MSAMAILGLLLILWAPALFTAYVLWTIWKVIRNA